MTRKNTFPIFPQDYIGKNAELYDSKKWMERNQKRTTLKCLSYLLDEKLSKIESENQGGKRYLILDLGCGTGFSSEILMDYGFKVIGVDILGDMLSLANAKKKMASNNNLELILADINHLPLKKNSIDHAISVSAYNFIIYEKKTLRDKKKVVNKTAKQLNVVLKKKGRIIIEFYPKDEDEFNLFKNSIINNGFKGYIVNKNPKQKSGQIFLLLKKKR